MQRDASVERWRRGRAPLPEQHEAFERKAGLVLVLTMVTMVVELVAGWLTGSMALLAEGWHMGAHTAALGIAAFAYAFARRHAVSERLLTGMPGLDHVTIEVFSCSGEQCDTHARP